MQNPYQSPQSAAMPAIALPGKRPLSVWVLLAALGAMASLLTINAIILGAFVASHPRDVNGIYVFGLMFCVITVPVAVVALLGIVRRQPWARWLGIFTLTALTAVILIQSDQGDYTNDIQSTGAFLAWNLLVPALMGWWIYAFGFSRKARLYFTP